MKKGDEYSVPASCHICGKSFMARYNMKGRAKVCTPPTHVCKGKVVKRDGHKDKIITCVENCCRSQYSRGAASSSMDNAIDHRKVLSAAEFKKMWEATKALPQDEGIALRFIASTGCRLAETFLVRKEAISFSQGPYSTVRLLTLKRKGRPPRTVHIKNGTPFIDELKAWVKKTPDGGQVFNVARRTLQRALERVLDKVKSDREGLVHILRHTRASQLVKAGADLTFVRHELGWSSLEMAKIYAHTDEDSIAKVLGKI